MTYGVDGSIWHLGHFGYPVFATLTWHESGLSLGEVKYPETWHECVSVATSRSRGNCYRGIVTPRGWVALYSNNSYEATCSWGGFLCLYIFGQKNLDVQWKMRKMPGESHEKVDRNEKFLLLNNPTSADASTRWRRHIRYRPGRGRPGWWWRLLRAAPGFFSTHTSAWPFFTVSWLLQNNVTLIWVRTWAERCSSHGGIDPLAERWHDTHARDDFI